MSNRILLSPGYFPDPDTGRPLAFAQIFVGIVNLDPTVVGNQVQLQIQQESGAIINVAQPLLTDAGGVPEYNGSPVTMIIAEANYSLTVLDAGGAQKYYVPNTPYGSVATADIDDRAVTRIKIALATIEEENIKPLTITAASLATNSVPTAKIVNDAVDKDKIAADVAGIGISQDVDGSLEIDYASQAEQVAATSLVKAVNPAVQQFHPSAIKANVNFNGTGVLTVNSSYNVSSVTDSGVGLFQVNFTNSFADIFYNVNGWSRDPNLIPSFGLFVTAGSAYTKDVGFIILTTVNTSGNAVDSPEVSITFAGTLA